MHNGTLLAIASILKHMVSSVAEVGMGALFINMRYVEVIRTTLEDMGWTQREPKPIATNNFTVVGIANDTIKQRRSKAMDIRFYWCQDRV